MFLNFARNINNINRTDRRHRVNVRLEEAKRLTSVYKIMPKSEIKKHKSRYKNTDFRFYSKVIKDLGKQAVVLFIGGYGSTGTPYLSDVKISHKGKRYTKIRNYYIAHIEDM